MGRDAPAWVSALFLISRFALIYLALELMATLPGIEFYKSCGFSTTGNVDLDLKDGVKLELVPMRKELL